MSDWFNEFVREAAEHGGGTAYVTNFKVLPDGGELIFTGNEIEEVGDRGIPKRVLYRHSGDKDRPGLEVAIEVQNGIPAITRVTVTADSERGVRIRTKDIRIADYDLEGRLAYWLSEVTHRRATEALPDGRRPWWRYSQVPAEERKDAIRNVEQARRGLRRGMTDELLMRVAEVYRAADPPRRKAIELAFDTSERSAARWIAEAKRRGFIDG
jgi:hypothetical protein